MESARMKKKELKRKKDNDIARCVRVRAHTNIFT